ncbi:MAG: hypothetical protein ACE5GV_00245 [Candidatus Scalindua sp.]
MKINPGIPLGNYSLNIEKTKYLIQKLAWEYFPGAHAEIGCLSEKISLKLPCEKLTNRIPKLFTEYIGENYEH